MNKLCAGGVLAILAGGVMISASFIGSPANVSGAQVASPTATFCGNAPCTSTPVTGARSATPTTSPTSAATATSVPATSVPTTKPNTPVPAAPTSTSPAGGAGAGISGPNTGTGDGTAGGQGMMFELIIGAALAVLGAGLITRGVMRRR